MRDLRLWTFTNEYVVVMVDGQRFVRADVEYSGNLPTCNIDGTVYVVSRIQPVVA